MNRYCYCCFRRKSSCILIAAVISLTISTADAGVIAVEIDTPFGISGTSNFMAGWSFRVEQAVDIVSLGWMDLSADGLDGSHEVGLWTVGGSLLTSTTIPLGTASRLDGLFSTGGFRFESISPISLPVGEEFVIAGFIGTEDLTRLFDSTGTRMEITTPPEITFLRPRLNLDGTFKFPEIEGAAGALGSFGPNFEFRSTAVPEPASITLVGIGLLSVPVVAIRRRRRDLTV